MDEAKSQRNAVKHRLSFETAALVFDDPQAISYPERVVEGEERWQTIRLIGGAVIILVAHTYEESEGEPFIRIISARKATAAERRIYEKPY